MSGKNNVTAVEIYTDMQIRLWLRKQDFPSKFSKLSKVKQEKLTALAETFNTQSTSIAKKKAPARITAKALYIEHFVKKLAGTETSKKGASQMARAKWITLSEADRLPYEQRALSIKSKQLKSLRDNAEK